jgi:ankyrin repeat protein
MFNNRPLLLRATLDEATTMVLLEANAEVNTGDTYDASTALHRAAVGGNINVCKALLQRGANIEALTSLGESPLMMARSPVVTGVYMAAERQC